MNPNLPIFASLAAIALLVTTAQIDGRQQNVRPSDAPIPTETPPAAPAAPNAPGTSQDGKPLIDRAIFNLESRHSISADIHHEIDLFGQQLLGNGSYYEERSGPRPRIRLELKIPFGDSLGALDTPAADQTGTLVRVCDGRYLWTYRRLLDKGKLSRVDLDRVAKAIEDAKNPLNRVVWMDSPARAGSPGCCADSTPPSASRCSAKPRCSGCPCGSSAASGGPSDSPSFCPPRRKPSGRAGEWTSPQLPAHLPECVLLFLGTQDLFPYRFEYRRSEPKEDEDADASRAIVTMQLLKVNVNVPIDPAQFDYRPGDIKPDDETDQYLKTLGL